MSETHAQASTPNLWLRLTLAGAVVLTMLDAGLIQRRYGFLTGGFLARDHIETPVQFVAFFVTSLVADAAVIGLITAAVLWVASRLGLFRSAPFLSFSTAVGALVAADFVYYRLLGYLSDAFDVVLMFDLVGGQISELLAVAAGHLLAPMTALVVAGLIVATTAAIIERGNHRVARPRSPGLLGPTTLLVVGLVATTACRLSSPALDNGLRRKPSSRVLEAVVRVATDFDRDGFGLVGRPSDPDAWDASRFPYAIDVPGNGIDENAVGGDLPAGMAAYDEASGQPPIFTSRPSVVLFVLESFRADLVGSVLGGTPVTPTLDALAARGAAAELAFSHNGYTAQSRHHIMGGTLANLRGGTTLVDDFKANGYEVAYFSGQDESFGGPRYAVGFERADVAYDARSDRDSRYSTFTTAGSLAVPFTQVRERIRQFLAQRNPGRPLFLYVNFHDTHFPYHHEGMESLVGGTVLSRPEIEPDRASDLWAMYANTAANVDRAVAGVVGDVTSALGGEPGIVVIGDHGESLFDDGSLGHGFLLNDAQTRIPLITANLPLLITDPFGQADLRQALWDALRQGRRREESPRRRVDARKRVFQYLGTIRRPRQIAFVAAEGRLVFDLRTGRVSARGGRWVRPESLAPKDASQLEQLVYAWEAMAAAAARQEEAEQSVRSPEPNPTDEAPSMSAR